MVSVAVLLRNSGHGRVDGGDGRGDEDGGYDTMIHINFVVNLKFDAPRTSRNI